MHLIIAMYITMTFLARIMTAAKDFKLELVQVLFRHGARTCSELETRIPMPGYVDQELHQAYGYGQLVNAGKAQAYELGRALRARYAGFLGPAYRPDDLYAYSSDYDRTKMSLQLVLAGLYPPAGAQAWSPELAWMPLPCHYVPRELDVLLNAFEKQRYKKLLNEVLKSPAVEQEIPKILEFSKFFEDKGITSIKRHLFLACLGIYNVLNSHKAAGAKLPEWYTDDLLDDIRKRVIQYFDIKSMTPEMIKLSIGPLIKRFIRNMNVNGETNNPRKIYLYSGHEMNLAPFTRAHKIQDFKYPDFANAVILEKLRDSQNRLYVRMLYWAGKNDEFTTLKLGNCDEYCPIDEYLKIVENVVPSDEEMEAIFNDRNTDLKEILATDSAFRPKYKQ